MTADLRQGKGIETEGPNLADRRLGETRKGTVMPERPLLLSPDLNAPAPLSAEGQHCTYQYPLPPPPTPSALPGQREVSEAPSLPVDLLFLPRAGGSGPAVFKSLFTDARTY